ncbi:hypothetical protein Plhal304r1_c003g0013921 [Plasmopara halstedii]
MKELPSEFSGDLKTMQAMLLSVVDTLELMAEVALTTLEAYTRSTLLNGFPNRLHYDVILTKVAVVLQSNGELTNCGNANFRSQPHITRRTVNTLTTKLPISIYMSLLLYTLTNI